VNSLAGVLFVTFLCGLHILKDADKKQLKYAYIKLGLILIGIAFLLTNSRIMYAIGLLVCLFYLVKKGYKQNYISKKMITILIRTLIFIGITVSVGMIFSKELRDTGGKLVFRVSELNERFAYYHDSVGIVQDNPAIGLGAGGWASRQSEYQSSLYSTRYNHSSIMQALVDGGFIGIILFLLIFIWPNVKGFLIYKKTGSRDISFPLLINLIMFAHSLLDFDFSIPIFMIIFIMNNILILTKCELLEQKKPRQEVSKVNNLSKFLLKKVLLFLTIIIAVVAILCGIAGGLSEHFFDKGVIAYNKQLYQEAIDNMEVSVKLNPFHTEAHYLMSYAYKNITNENSISNGINSYYMNGQKHINKAQLLDKYNPKYFLARGNLYFGAGDYENSTKEYEQLVRYQPLIWYNYELLTMSLEAEIKSLEGPSESSKERIRIATDKLEGIPFLIEKAKEKYSFWTFRVKHKPE
jgi:tetratricopeptide (TPR) repeat protein